MLLCLMPPLLPSMAPDLKMRGLLLIYCGSYKTILDMWLQVVHILSNTQSLNTKFFCFTGRRVLSNIDGMYCLLSNGTE
uniref:Uncharacterized protein n=1 Tax=Helianthus annuus TaxID=4232 RepID=A0A251TDW5_HELAN